MWFTIFKMKIFQVESPGVFYDCDKVRKMCARHRCQGRRIIVLFKYIFGLGKCVIMTFNVI